MSTDCFQIHNDHIKVLFARDYPQSKNWKSISSFEELSKAINQKDIVSSVFATQCFLKLCTILPESFIDKISAFQKLYPISTYTQTLLTRLQMVSNNKEVCLSLIEEILSEEQKALEACSQNINSLIQSGERLLLYSHSGQFESIYGGRIMEALKLAVKEQKDPHVFLITTSPKNDALKLMAEELKQNKITYTLAPDAAAALLIRKSKVQKAFSSAKRIAANGDTVVDSFGYSMALFCDHHSIPFYSCGFHNMVDKNISTGESFSVQFTEPSDCMNTELFKLLDEPRVYAPEVDVVPAKLITGWVMEDGLVTGTF